MLSKIPVPPGNVFRIAAENPDAAAAAEAYEQTLQKFFALQPGQFPVFDLILLGMGPDGHTASLFPSTAGLQEKSRLVIANWVEKFKTSRITLTLPVLNAARCVAFLVSGTDKAPALHAVLEERCPGRAVSFKAGSADGWEADLAGRPGRGQRTFNQELSSGKPNPASRRFPSGLCRARARNSRTRWRECSNSWMSAQTSACHPLSWAADSPQVAQRVCRVTGIGLDSDRRGPGQFHKDAADFLNLFVLAENVLVAQQVPEAEFLGFRLGFGAGVKRAVLRPQLFGGVTRHPENLFVGHRGFALGLRSRLVAAVEPALADQLR